MSSINGLAKALNDVHLGGLIDDCVVTFEDDKAYIRAMDLTSSLFVETSAEVEHEEGQIGISNLSLFVKYLNTIKDLDVTIKHKENRMSIKPKDGGTVNYMLSEVDLIPSFDDEWEDTMFEDEIALHGNPMALKQVRVSDFLSIIGLFQPNSIYFKVSEKGIVSVHGGAETEHQFDVTLGRVKEPTACEVKVYGKHLTPILAGLNYEEEPQLYLTEGESIVISTTSSNWILEPISSDA